LLYVAFANPDGREVKVLGLQPLDSWDGGFEFRRGHGCSSLAFVVRCVGSGLCHELITDSEESCRVCVCV